MLVGKYFDEPTIYRAAAAFEGAGDWKKMWSDRAACQGKGRPPAPATEATVDLGLKGKNALVTGGSKGLSSQLIAKGIRVNAVSPGNTYFEGGIWQNIEQGMPYLFKTAMSLNPTGHMGTAQEVAAGVVFLASPVASRISGTNLIIDGALTKAV